MPEDNENASSQADAAAPAVAEPVADASTAEEAAAAPLDSATAAEQDSTSLSASGETAGSAVDEPIEAATAEEEADEEIAPVAAEEDAPEQTSFNSVEEAVSEINRLRKENASRRISNRELSDKVGAIQEAFGDSGEEFQQGWLDLAKAFQDNPEDPEVRAIFAELAGVQQEDRTPLDESAIFEKVRADYESKQQQLEIQKIQNALVTKARELGYNPDATSEDDVVAFNNNRLLWAQLQSVPVESGTPSERLDTAHAAVQAYEQAVLDRKLAELAAANTGVPAASATGQADSTQSDSKAPAGLNPAQKMKWAKEQSIRLAEQQVSRPNF